MREYQKKIKKKKKTFLIKFVGKEFGLCNMLELPEIEYRQKLSYQKCCGILLKPSLKLLDNTILQNVLNEEN
jgi:hypothetical protein